MDFGRFGWILDVIGGTTEELPRAHRGPTEDYRGTIEEPSKLTRITKTNKKLPKAPEISKKQQHAQKSNEKYKKSPKSTNKHQTNPKNIYKHLRNTN